MPRTALNYSALAANGAVAASPAAVDVANGHVISWAEPERTILVVANTDASARTITVLTSDAGAGGSSPSLAVSVPASSTRHLGPFESARYQRRDGSVWIDYGSGFTGTVTALLIPRGV